MMTLNLFRAEWLKTRKRMVNRALLAIIPAMMLVMLFSTVTQLIFDPKASVAEAQEILPFPSSLWQSSIALTELGMMLVIVFVAANVGSEYGRDTWKAIIPRYGSRTAFLASKWAVGLASLLLLAVTVSGVMVVLGWLGALIAGVDPNPAAPINATMALKNHAVTVLTFTFMGTLTMFLTVVTRSSIGGVIGGLLTTSGLTLLRDLLPEIVEQRPGLGQALAWLLPVTHIGNLRDVWVRDREPAKTLLTAIVGEPVPASTSMLIILGLTALLLTASLLIFSRRDME